MVAMVPSRFSMVFPARSALDLGTGCGVVALLLSAELGSKVALVASDVSVNAVYGAREEMKRQGLPVEVIQAGEGRWAIGWAMAVIHSHIIYNIYT